MRETQQHRTALMKESSGSAARRRAWYARMKSENSERYQTMLAAQRKRDAEEYAAIKADPVRYRKYLDRKCDEQRRAGKQAAVMARRRTNSRRKHHKIKSDKERLARQRERKKLWARRRRKERAAELAAYHRERRRAKKAKTLRPISRQNIYDMTRSAVPATLPRDVRDDVIGAVVLAALDGEITQHEIAGAVKRYVQQHYAMFDKFRTTSIDAPVPGTDGWRLIDTLVDEASYVDDPAE